MAEEVFRVRIPVEIDDRTGPEIERVRRSVNGLVRQTAAGQERLRQMAGRPISVRVLLQDHATRALGRILSHGRALAARGITIPVRVLDRASGVLRGILDLATAPLRMLTSPFGLLGVAAGGAGLGALFGVPLKMAADLEQTTVSFEMFLGSAERAKKLLGEIRDFADRTPFEFPELRDTALGLISVGVAADQVVRGIRAIGSAAKAWGAGQPMVMERITLALRQMISAGRLRGQEVRQLEEANIPVRQILAEGFGQTTAQIETLLEAGRIKADKAYAVLVAGIEKRTKDILDRQSKTLLGSASTLSDLLKSKFLMSFGEGLSSVLTPQLQRLIGWLDRNGEAVRAWQQSLFDAGQAIAGFVTDKLGGLLRNLRALAASPEFREGNLWDKLKVSWHTEVVQPLEEWWAGGGKAAVEEKAREIGGALGGGLGGAVRGAFLSLLGKRGPEAEQEADIFTTMARAASAAFWTEFGKAVESQKLQDTFYEVGGKVSAALLAGLKDRLAQELSKNPILGALFNIQKWLDRSNTFTPEEAAELERMLRSGELPKPVPGPTEIRPRTTATRLGEDIVGGVREGISRRESELQEAGRQMAGAFAAGLQPMLVAFRSGLAGGRAGQLLLAGGAGRAGLGQVHDLALQVFGNAEMARVATAIAKVEGGLTGAVGDNGQAFGPYQFHRQGVLAAYARDLGLPLDKAGEFARQNPLHAAAWALRGYLGAAIRQGYALGLRGPALAEYAQRVGQRSRHTERAAEAYQQLYMRQYAEGGLLTEPVLGVGLRSGAGYAFGERGPEMVTPVGQGTGVNVTVAEGAVQIVLHEVANAPEVRRIVLAAADDLASVLARRLEDVLGNRV